MADTYDKNATLAQVTTYANERWCWDDTSMITELFENHYNPETDTPKQFIDDLARDYDLTDPREVNWGNDFGM